MAFLFENHLLEGYRLVFFTDGASVIRDYIENVTCYALRRELNLRISSNRVEKANDIVVATRQKHNGMSWSKSGSGALAIITAARINGELENWMATGEVEFKMVG